MRTKRERLYAKIIDWFACQLTPKTIYYPRENPFAAYEKEQNKPLAFYAAFHMIKLACDSNAEALKFTAEGFSDADKDYGDWEVIVRKISGSPNDH